LAGLFATAMPWERVPSIPTVTHLISSISVEINQPLRAKSCQESRFHTAACLSTTSQLADRWSALLSLFFLFVGFTS
jgi:hypothetical protein